MPIVFRPGNARMTCAACNAHLVPALATAAGHDAHGFQVFACESHLGERYVPTWAGFVAEQIPSKASAPLAVRRAAYRYIEELPTRDKWPVVEHLSARLGIGSVVVLRPADDDSYYGALRKIWKAHLLRTRKQWASMPPSKKRHALAGILDGMDAARFTTEPPDVRPDANVYVIPAQEPVALPDDCMTLYATTPLADRYGLLKQILPGGLIVQCVKPERIPKRSPDYWRQHKPLTLRPRGS